MRIPPIAPVLPVSKMQCSPSLNTRSQGSGMLSLAETGGRGVISFRSTAEYGAVRFGQTDHRWPRHRRIVYRDGCGNGMPEGELAASESGL
jgi:hypothetical protein